jgi:N-acyl-D-aspartate/D-glutamate deacylase
VGPFEDFVVRSFHRMFRLGDPPDYEPTADLSAAAVAARDGRTAREVVYDWLLEDQGRGVVYFPLFNYHHGHADHLAALISHPRTVVGLGDGGAHCGAICDASIPTFLLSWWARDRPRGTLPIERVVHAHTRRTALAYGLDDRGLVAPGYRADLVLVDLDRVALDAPRLTWDLPAGGRRWVQGARGIERVWVAGVPTWERGVPTGALPGRLVRGARATA